MWYFRCLMKKTKITLGLNLVIQWLRHRTSTIGDMVQFLVRELRFCMSCDIAKKSSKKILINK